MNQQNCFTRSVTSIADCAVKLAIDIRTPITCHGLFAFFYYLQGFYLHEFHKFAFCDRLITRRVFGVWLHEIYAKYSHFCTMPIIFQMNEAACDGFTKDEQKMYCVLIHAIMIQQNKHGEAYFDNLIREQYPFKQALLKGESAAFIDVFTGKPKNNYEFYIDNNDIQKFFDEHFLEIIDDFKR